MKLVYGYDCCFPNSKTEFESRISHKTGLVAKSYRGNEGIHSFASISDYGVTVAFVLWMHEAKVQFLLV